MTDLNKLADDLATLAAAKTYTARERLAVDVLANLPAILSALRSRPTREAVAWPTPMDVDRIIEDHWIMGEGPHPDVNEAIIKLFKERFDASPTVEER
jgi:hypothetical protein